MTVEASASLVVVTVLMGPLQKSVEVKVEIMLTVKVETRKTTLVTFEIVYH